MHLLLYDFVEALTPCIKLAGVLAPTAHPVLRHLRHFLQSSPMFVRRLASMHPSFMSPLLVSTFAQDAKVKCSASLVLLNAWVTTHC